MWFLHWKYSWMESAVIWEAQVSIHWLHSRTLCFFSLKYMLNYKYINTVIQKQIRSSVCGILLRPFLFLHNTLLSFSFFFFFLTCLQCWLTDFTDTVDPLSLGVYSNKCVILCHGPCGCMNLSRHCPLFFLSTDSLLKSPKAGKSVVSSRMRTNWTDL